MKKIKEGIDKIKRKVKIEREIKKIKLETLDRLSTLLTAAFAFVAALAWNGAVESLFKKYYVEYGGILPKFSYAVVVTIVAAIVSIYVTRAIEKFKR